MTPPIPPALPPPTLPILLDRLPSGVVYYTPVLDAAGQLVDFRFAYLNAAAQQLLGLAGTPLVTFREQWPSGPPSEAFANYRDAFLAGTSAQFDQPYRTENHSGTLHVHATRLEEGLLVSLTREAEPPRPAAAEAQRESLAQQPADEAGAAVREDLHRFFDQTPVGISLVRGPQLVVEFLNDEAATLLGSTRAQLLGQPLLEALPTIREQGFEPTFRRVLQGETFTFEEIPVTFSSAHLGKAGQGFYRVIYQPWRNETGEVIGMVTVAVEVTEQVVAKQQLLQLNQELEALVLARTQALRQAHAATEQEREQLYQVFEQTPVAIAIMRGTNLRVELANPAVAAIWGREPAQVLGRPYFEAIPDTAGQGFEQILADVLTTGQPFTITEAPVTLDRTHTGQPGQAYVNFTFQPLRDALGHITGLIASGTEVTEQVLARQQVQHLNQELRASNEVLEARVQARTAEMQQAQVAAEAERATLQNVFEEAPMALAILAGPTHIVTFANAEMGLIWGRSPSTILGRNHFEALPDLAGQGFEAIFADVYHTGKPYYLREQPVQVDRAGTGQPMLGYYHITYQPLHDGQHHITAIIASAVEVTHQVVARQQVQQLNEELEGRVRARTAETQAALLEAQDQREQLREQQSLLRQILGQVPAAVATLSGPEHRFQFINERYQVLVGGRARLGGKVADQLPEVEEQGFLNLLDRVYASGEPFMGQDIAILLHDPHTGAPNQRYLDFAYQPLFDSQHQSQGILVFAVDTTEKVRARRQADTLQAAALAAVQRRALQRQELYQIFAQTPVAIVLLREPNHRIDYFNPAFEELFPPEEWTGGDLHGHTLEEVYPRIKLAGLMQLIDRVYETGEPQAVIDMPLAELQPGSPRYVTLSYQAYREEGRIVGVAAFAYDVTEQVLGRAAAQHLQAELLAGAQRRAEERQELLNLFERAPVAVALLREPDHRLEYFNTAFELLYPGENLRGKTVADAYPSIASADVIGRLDRVYQTGETYQGLEQPLRTASPEGAPRYVTFTYQAYREHEDIAGVAVFIHEVTEQVRARQAREAQQQLVATVFEQSPTAIFVLRGPHYVIEIVNPLMEQILGHPRAELLGRPYFEAIPELLEQGYASFMDQVWHTGQAVVVQEQPGRLSYHQPGETSYFTFVYQPLRDEPQGPVTGIACVTVDVTAQVQARQQVQHLNEELAAINQEMQATNKELHDTNARLTRTNTDLDTFVYTASHDLKAPIANIEGLLLALRQHLPADALEVPLVPRLFDMMQGSVTRFQQTLGHLTNISQLQQAEAPETIDLPALIHDVRLDLAPLLESAPATLTVEVDGCQAVRVAAKTLRSVVYNLLSNAVKYRALDRPAQVHLRAASATGHLLLTVQDNGLGLTPAQQGELFGMFRRLHTHVEGSGVGLYMVKRLVENAGGTITVESQLGVGSTFTVSLPA